MSYPFQVIAVDLVGPLPRSKKGNKWILIVSCWFTKYTMIFPLRSSKSRYVEQILEEKVFHVHGPPALLICDNGSQFTSKTFKALSKTYEFNIRFNPYYSPQCNFVERSNRTIGTAIRSYVDSHDMWDVHITQIQFAISSAKHEVTGFTPSFLVFGRHVPVSGNYYKDRDLDVQADQEIFPEDRDSYASSLLALRDIFNEVKQRLHAAHERNAKTYNLRNRDISFRVGDHVWRRNRVLSSAVDKFSAKLVPKYVHSIVRKKLSNLVYELTDEDGTKVGRWHIKDLKPLCKYDPEDSVDSEGTDD